MPSAAEFSAQLKNTVLTATSEFINNLPSIAGAVILLLVGWLIARLIRLATIKFLNLMNHFLERLLTGRTRAVVRFSSGVTRLVGGILFWITLFIFTTAALRIAGLAGIASWLERIVEYLPSIITGGLIILFGYVLSSLVKDVTLAAAHTGELAEAEIISRLAQAITFVTALIIGIDQIGIDVTFITTMLGVSTAALLTGFALAFGIGARTLVSNLIASHYMKELIEPSQKIRIGEWEGTVLAISATAVILNTPEGRLSIPAKLYQEQPVVVLTEEPDDE